VFNKIISENTTLDRLPLLSKTSPSLHSVLKHWILNTCTLIHYQVHLVLKP